MKQYLIFLTILVHTFIYSQRNVEAEIDTTYFYQFESLKDNNNKRVLIDKGHNTIYSEEVGITTAREMFRIIKEDGYEVDYTKKNLSTEILNPEKFDLLILHGIPNNKVRLKLDSITETLYISPLKNEEVEAIGNYVFNGGGLFLFLSHFPGGSGGLPLLEAFGVKFRDGYAYQNQYHTSNKGKCGHFLMNSMNKMLKENHPIFTSTLDTNTIPENIRFYCGAAIFRNPEDVILGFPENTTNYTPTNEPMDIEENSNSYAGMIGFKYGLGRIIICTDQGIFRSLNLLIDNKRIPVTIHDPESDNAGLLLNSLRWLTKNQ
ncbi:hypothetical protein D7030_04740 [Flavobacteriaceae bacterium AU392]|nr:hypothetical protein D1817_11215 [Flavobacteriaceae bacterium]RKM85983.1 hypothetical protein D7030_04740 [Flavobacteriaceae bacterium AU392]